MADNRIIAFPDHKDVFQHKDAEALKFVLRELGVQVRYNLRSQKAELSWDGKVWLEMNDRIVADLRRKISNKYKYQSSRGLVPLHYGETTWRLWLNALLFEKECDPFRIWLEKLPDWDRVDRLDKWLADVFDIQNGETELVQWASRFIFLGVVWRTFQPGTKLDEMPVLIGPQGIGKSMCFRLVLPPEMQDLFNDGLNLAMDPKFRAEALQGRAIVEASEMAGSTRAELESLKAFISRTDDGGVRLAFRRDPESLPRRCIIVGTTNQPECLPNDPTGNRRFVPIVLTGGNPVELIQYMVQNREQLWAEALYRYVVESAEIWLPSELKQQQASATETARRKDEILEDAIESELATMSDGDHIALPELIKRIGKLGERNIDRRTGAVLRLHGYDKTIKDGRKVWVKREK